MIPLGVYALNRFKELRLKAGLTQKALADVLGVERSSIVKYETGKNGPSAEILQKLADYYGVSTDFLLGRESTTPSIPKPTGGVWIPVLGEIAAGIPIEAVTDIIDYEEIPEAMARDGEYFALKIKGGSMEPRMLEGDVVIVRKQSMVDTGDIAVVLVNGDSATVKKVKIMPEGIMLIPLNPAYETMFYPKEDVERLPVQILGKVVELRGKF
jgi:repressor LexA